MIRGRRLLTVPIFVPPSSFRARPSLRFASRTDALSGSKLNRRRQTTNRRW